MPKVAIVVLRGAPREFDAEALALQLVEGGVA